MIKKKKMKFETLLQNPYIFYVTNLGFVGSSPLGPQSKKDNHQG